MEAAEEASTSTAHFFQTPLKHTYQRNKNSRSKTKNLRCFPSCAIEGQHTRHTFCGRSVSLLLPLHLTLPSSSSAQQQQQQQHSAHSSAIAAISAFAQFAPADAPIPADITPPPANAVRSKACPTGEWISVAVGWKEPAQVELEVNPDLLGWHYGWRSNKNTRLTRHCLRVFLFHAGAFTRLLQSSSFLVYSGKHFITPPPAPKRKAFENGDQPADDLHHHSDGFALLSKKKLDPERVQVEPRVPSIRALLERALKVGEDVGGLGDDGEMGNEDLDLEVDLAGMDVDEDGAIRLIESLLDDGIMNDLTSLATGEGSQGEGGDEVRLGDLGTETEMEKEMPSRGVQMERIKQIRETLVSEALTEELCAFLQECSQGSLGQSLCESLEKEEDAMANRFVVDLTQSLFRRFQKIITGRVELDLFEQGLIPRCSLHAIRAAQPSSVAAFHDMDDQDALVYDEKDTRLLQRFLNLMYAYGRLPNLDKLIQETPREAPFAIVNKVWVETSGMLKPFFAEKMVELGFLKPTSGKLMVRLHSSKKTYVTQERLQEQGPPMLSFHGYIEMMADGQGHRLYEVSPLFGYVEVEGRSYVYAHELLADGSFHSEACIFFIHEGQQVFIYSDTIVRVDKPDEMVIQRKLLRRPEPIEATGILQCCREQTREFLIQGCEFTFIYTAKQATAQDIQAQASAQPE